MSVIACERIIEEIKKNGLPERRPIFVKLAIEMFGLTDIEKAGLLEKLFDLGYDIGCSASGNPIGEPDSDSVA